MERFRVSVNGEQQTIGIAGRGVLTAIVSTVIGEKGHPHEERRCSLSLATLESDTNTHFTWKGHELQQGDEVTIEVLSAGEFDPPVGDVVHLPDILLEGKKRSLRNLAEELGWELTEN